MESVVGEVSEPQVELSSVNAREVACARWLMFLGVKSEGVNIETISGGILVVHVGLNSIVPCAGSLGLAILAVELELDIGNRVDAAVDEETVVVVLPYGDIETFDVLRTIVIVILVDGDREIGDGEIVASDTINLGVGEVIVIEIGVDADNTLDLITEILVLVSVEERNSGGETTNKGIAVVLLGCSRIVENELGFFGGIRRINTVIFCAVIASV